MGQKHPRRRIIVWIGAAVLAAAGVTVALMPERLPVEVAKVERGDLVVTVSEMAKTRLKNRHQVSAPIAGTLLRIDLEPGDRVEAGTVLARIVPLPSPLLDPRTRAETEARSRAASAALLRAQAAAKATELTAQHAAKDLERMRTLGKQAAATIEEVRHAELEAELRRQELVSAEFATRAAAHEADMARAALRSFNGHISDESFTVTSPIEGLVLRVIQESAGVVQPGTPLLEIGDPSRMEIVAELLTADAVRVRPAAKARVLRWGGSALEAHVRTIEPAAVSRISALGVEEQRATVVIDLDAPRSSWSALGDGYRVEVEIVLEERRDVLHLPVGAIFRRDRKWAGFKAKNGRAELIPLELGTRGDDRVEIASGAAEGDTLILHPSEKIAAGIRVEYAH